MKLEFPRRAQKLLVVRDGTLIGRLVPSGFAGYAYKALDGTTLGAYETLGAAKADIRRQEAAK